MRVGGWIGRAGLAEEVAVLADSADQFMGLRQRRRRQRQIGLTRIETLGQQRQALIGQRADQLVGRQRLTGDLGACLLQNPGRVALGQTDDAP